MLFKTKGIVLNFVKFRESSIIVKIYTEDFGLKSYIVNGVRSHKAKSNKIALYQPLSLLDLVIYNRENANINRISEVKLYFPYYTISTDNRKTVIAIFLTEILTKCLKEEEGNKELFAFLLESFTTLDKLETKFENFHLQFMIKLSQYLGFGISSHYDFEREINQVFHFDSHLMVIIDQLIEKGYQEFTPSNGHARGKILEALVRFFQYHQENFGEVKSIAILKEIQ